MNKLSRANREKVHQFMTIAGSNCTEKAALAALKANDWNLEAAFDFFYNQPPSRPVTDPRHLEELYLRYKDPHCDMVLVDGVSLFCEDLLTDPGDVVMLVISWHMKAATMCEFSRQEFIGGLQSLGVDSIEKLKYLLSTLRAELKDERIIQILDFLTFCHFGFHYRWLELRQALEQMAKLNLFPSAFPLIDSVVEVKRTDSCEIQACFDSRLLFLLSN